MTADIRPDLARVAALIADPARAAMLWSLMDGQTRPAGELARIAGVSPQAASAHFARLLDGGLIIAAPRGRWRFYRLAGTAVAELIERLAAFGGDAPTVATPPRVPDALRALRCCYDHCAGRIAVDWAARLVARGCLDRETLAPTAAGADAFARLGIDLAALAAAKRPVARACPDWTERVPHLGGGLGAALLGHALAAGWVVRIGGGRALRLTPRGAAEVAAWLA